MKILAIILIAILFAGIGAYFLFGYVSGTSSVGIIGSADGPTTIYVA